MVMRKTGTLENGESEKTWSFLQGGISEIMEHLERGMSYTRSMELYTTIYNFCTQNKMQRFSEASGTNSGRGAQLMGAELYYRLSKYLSAHLEKVLAKIRSSPHDVLLQSYASQWKDYTVGAGFVHHIFKYLNRHWVRREMDEGKPNVYDIYTLSLVLWKDTVFDPLADQILAALLALITQQRDGQVIDTSLVKRVVDSYVSLGIDETDPTKPTTEVYRELFGKQFIDATILYYQNESERYLAHNTISEYMNRAEARLHEEEGRIEMYLHQSSTTPLMQACDDALLKAHHATLYNEFPSLLETSRKDDITRMYRLLKRIPAGLDPLRKQFENHVRQAGLTAIERIRPEANEESTGPKAYVNALLAIHALYNALVLEAFQGDAEFIKALDNACREFVNRNAVCHESSTRSPELLAKYCDTLLKKSAKGNDDGDLETILQNIMVVFKYVEDKDVFQKFYTKQLARRLVNAASASDDAEASMLTKLKEACGFEYTNKLQRMFGDVAISKDLNAAYTAHKEATEVTESFDAEFLVLGGAFWPLTPTVSGYLIPGMVHKCHERFSAFYHGKHSGRKLQWCWHLGKADIKTNYLSQKLIFTVSHYQLAILLAFNQSLELTLEELQGITGIDDKVQLDGALGILVKAKVLHLNDVNSAGQATKKYSLNTSLKSKKLKMNLNLPIKSEQKNDSNETHKTIEEDRKMLTQSAIVRIMKARKQLKHNLLVQETISQVKARFLPRIPDIKKCIDILIEKEYLERSEKDEYSYLA